MYKKYNFVKKDKKMPIKNVHGTHVDCIRMRDYK